MAKEQKSTKDKSYVFNSRRRYIKHVVIFAQSSRHSLNYFWRNIHSKTISHSEQCNTYSQVTFQNVYCCVFYIFKRYPDKPRVAFL